MQEPKRIFQTGLSTSVAAWVVVCAVSLMPGLVHAQATSSAPTAPASSLVAFVKTVTPEAEVLVDGKAFRASPGMPLQSGFRVRTGANGSLGVAFRDDTMMSFGPNTEFVVDEYLYAPAKDELKLSGSILRGTMQYVSGVIAKLKPEAVSIHTPKGMLGLRGTRVAIKVDD
jgi:hypothetical protein